MTELKTLKDIYEEWNMDCLDCGCHYQHQERLKQEAIKWIKELRIQSKENPNDNICEIDLSKANPKKKIVGKALMDSVKRDTYNYIQEKWIKQFFNISEGDLR